MQVIQISDIAVNPTPLGGSSRMLADRPDLRLVNLVLRSGEKVNAHSAEVEVIFIVLTGSGIIFAGDEEARFKAGQMIACPAGITRAISAGFEGADILVVRAPNL